VVLGIVELVRAFCRTGGGRSKNFLVKTHLQTTPTPCKNTKNDQPSSTTNLTCENPTIKYRKKLLFEVSCEGWVQWLWKRGKMEDGARKMNVVAGYGGMGPMGAVGDDLVVIGGVWW
jgi:hypothetical protein